MDIAFQPLVGGKNSYCHGHPISHPSRLCWSHANSFPTLLPQAWPSGFPVPAPSASARLSATRPRLGGEEQTASEWDQHTYKGRVCSRAKVCQGKRCTAMNPRETPHTHTSVLWLLSGLLSEELWSPPF